MDDQLPSMSNNPQQVPPVPAKKKPWLWIGIAVAITIVVLAIGVGLMFLLGSMSKPAQKTTSTSAATKTLFDALGKAASEPIIRVAMLRRTYATKADLASNTNPGTIQSSVAEISSQNFRALYAQRLFTQDSFSMQRCQDNNTTYIDGGAGTGRVQPKTLAEANEYLKQMYLVTQPLQFIICPHAGVMPGGGPDLAPARLSDGVMPVTLSKSQADQWKARAAELFEVTDQGMVAHGGKQLHKYSFAPRGEAADMNERLYDIFYETAEIDNIKRDHPKAEWVYEYINVNGGRRGGVQGFYLIDDTTGLPAYSEVQGIDKDDTRDTPVARATLGFNKQTYAFPTALTIELTSPLEILE